MINARIDLDTIAPIRESFPNFILTFDAYELFHNVVGGSVRCAHLVRRFRRRQRLVYFFHWHRTELFLKQPPLAGDVERHSFCEPTWRASAADCINEYMYEFMAQGCFQNSSLSQDSEWLELDGVVAGRGCGPWRHVCAANEVSGRFIDENLEVWDARL